METAIETMHSLNVKIMATHASQARDSLDLDLIQTVMLEARGYWLGLLTANAPPALVSDAYQAYSRAKENEAVIRFERDSSVDGWIP
ncbi:hypothetical protein ACNSTU_07300 [Aquisalimonas sp. APHAB1-3]|uniref:hypothetical protein n=1 Tax=Aquisalimonas sp. APHAB1-3 TaxID=3402080 RepID=UPI003AAF3D66